MPTDVALQINLSPGDVRYAARTVPALIQRHLGDVDRVLLVVDGCRPARTRAFDPDRRLPQDQHAAALAQVQVLVAGWVEADPRISATTIVPGDPRFEAAARRWLAPSMLESHEYGGTGLMAYLVGIDEPGTRYVLHYDADMLVHEGERPWLAQAMAGLAAQPDAVFATPRTAAPSPQWQDDRISWEEGRPKRKVEGGWLDDWFSTRCFLVDRARLEPHLPLVRGRLGWEMRLRRLLGRGYPMAPEILLFRRVGARGGRRFVVGDPDCYLVHPADKGDAFVQHLGCILERMQEGSLPPGQVGHENLVLPAWIAACASC